ncbi:contact-dependent growth inhibition system immunity protein [Xenorhabdus anantnagensis]|uniref:Contact-dependent growth inhibition system immunity protein n=1 Tax=Xenorhabdus anantnagensis TaxID=3025875 RepID=A0ABT5LWV9_9GAMM|nr:contact-dependent growth inhibition system immunity protein [Xenorhabdus anantnagensis]MDC9598218.1 contact-dependent growth inhibition system immunity protein [Xenorhabdus anantnagensis]
MKEIVKTAWASVFANEDFICITTYSGYISCQRDPLGAQHLVPHSTDDQALGRLLKDALAQSRFVTAAPRDDVWQHPDVTFDRGLYDYDSTLQRYADWVKNLMAQYQYKTKRALFKKMKKCSITCQEGKMTIRPSYHKTLESWTGDHLSESDHVILAADSPDAEIGAGIRLALSRCKG